MNEWYLFGYLDAMISTVMAMVFCIFVWKYTFNDEVKEQIKNSKIIKAICKIF